MGAAAAMIVAALLYFRNVLRARRGGGAERRVENGAGVSFVSCPVCGSVLSRGENLRSKVFRPMDVSDQLCVIYGCPHCFPVCEPGVRRQCPVCHKAVAPDGHLVARLFNKTKSGRKHIIINGCGSCNRTDV